MRWKPRDIRVWRRWFAWHPIQMDGELVWFEWVERCGTLRQHGYDTVVDWAYRKPLPAPAPETRHG